MKDRIIELDQVNFDYGQTQVLKDITLAIEAGDFVGLVGPNGSGKTTLIKVITGILSPSSGQVKVFGQIIETFSDWRRVGYVPQHATNFEQNFPANVEEIVAMELNSGRSLLSLTSRQDKARVQRALARVKMDSMAHKRIGELSGGQKQRVFIARALVTEPDLLILDEPTTGVDQAMQQTFYEILADLNRSGITIILVTHDFGHVTRQVNKLAFVNQTLRFFGSHEEFCALDPLHSHEQEPQYHHICLK